MLGYQVPTEDLSQTIGTSAVTVYTSAQILNRINYIRVWNVAPAGGGTIWLTRSTSVGLNVAPNAAGCFPLTPGQYEVFTTPQAIPINTLYAIATAANTPLSVEVG